jgi:hypothetical protein
MLMRLWLTYLELNLSLSNVLLAATTIGNLLDLSNLGSDSLQLKGNGQKSISRHLFVSTTYIGAEVLEGVCLHGVDAQSGVRLDDGETTRD